MAGRNNIESEFTQVILSAGRGIAIVVFVLQFGCAPPTSERHISLLVDAPVDREELLAGLARSSIFDVVYTLNELKKSSQSVEIVSMVECAYELCGHGQMNWNAESLSDPLVRANLLDLLVQANKRGQSSHDLERLHADALSMFSAGNEKVKQQLLLVLASIGSSADVARIVEFAAVTTDLQSFRYAVIALTRMSTIGGGEAIQSLFADATEQELEIIWELGLRGN